MVFFFVKLCILLEQFPNTYKKNKRLKSGEKNHHWWIDETSLCPCLNLASIEKKT